MKNLMEHDVIEDAHDTFDRSFIDAVNAGRWMAAAWKINQDGSMEMRRTTFDFPKDRLAEASKLLSENVGDELSNVILPTSPLPEAKDFVVAAEKSFDVADDAPDEDFDDKFYEDDEEDEESE